MASGACPPQTSSLFRAATRRENVLANDEVLVSVHLPAPRPGTRSVYEKVLDREAWTHAVVSAAVVLEMDRAVLGAVLRHVNDNQVKASEILGISRTTLRAKLRALRMSVEKSLLPETNTTEEDEEGLP